LNGIFSAFGSIARSSACGLGGIGSGFERAFDDSGSGYRGVSSGIESSFCGLTCCYINPAS